MTTYEVTAPQDDRELDRFAHLLAVSYGIDEQKAGEALRKSPRDALRVVRADGAVVGGLKWYLLGQWFSGRCVPCDGVAAVAIDPVWRGRGAAQTLMLEAARERGAQGVPIASLYPATVPLYRSVGYALAGVRERLELPLQGLVARDLEPELCEAGPADFAEMEAAQQVFASARNGMLRRDAILWERVRRVDGKDAHHFVVRGASGEVEAYLSFAQPPDWLMGKDLTLTDCVVNTAAAGRRLLAFLQSYSTLSPTAVLHGSVRHPLVGLASHGRTKTSLFMPWMTRILNVQAALEARGWPHGATGELHLDVRDDGLPANHRRFLLEVHPDATRVSDGGQGLLKIDVRGLAAAYTGFASAGELVTLGLLDGAPADLAAFDALFGTSAPWMPDFF
ncbi:MAG: GNAT family N-acetyltransferase [Planctomycetes bacterium]|nr:GNAT family N-acetyltransferase [Planctomycetota bacterium]